MNNQLRYFIRSITLALSIVAYFAGIAQIFPSCPDTVIIETQIESCEGSIPDFSSYANLPLGYTFSQSPAAGTVLSAMAEWTVNITLTASNGSSEENCSFLALLEPEAPPIPQNSWIAYCYNGKIILNQAVFRGYYEETNLDVSSWQLWDIGVSPSWHPDYIGCNVTLDQHSVVYRRTGFPCGNYQLDILNHDNEVRLYVDQQQVFAHDGYNLQHYNVFSGFLDANSLVEFEWNEGIGGSLGVLDLVLQCPTDTVLYLDANCQALMPDLRWTACSGGEVTQSIAPGTPLDSGEYPFTMTTTDVHGWSESCSGVMHVVDTLAPVIDTPVQLEVGYNSDCAFVLPDYSEVFSISDNCEIESQSQSPSPGTIITSETEVSFEVTDIYGNMATKIMTIVPVDNQAPSITCLGDISADIGSACEYIIPNFMSNVEVDDNCGLTSISQFPAPGTPISESGFYEITLTATDAVGLTATCSFNLELSDLTPPDMNCTDDTYFYVDAACEYLIPDLTLSLTYQDNCPSSLVLTQVPPAGSPMSSLDEVQITFTLEDGAGNSTSCSSTLHPIDTISPTLSIAPTINRNIDGSCSYLLEDFSSLIEIGEACENTSLTQSPPANTLFNFEDSPIQVSFVATDSSGNTSEISTELVLHDATSPTVACPESVEVYADASCMYLMPNVVMLTEAADACSTIQSMSQSPEAGEQFFQNPPDAIEILVYDMAGNSQTCSTQVHAFDTIAPTISLMDPVLLPLDNNCLITIPDFTAQIQALDNCSQNLELTQFPVAGALAEATQGISCTITATDDSGNEASTVIQIEYIDDSAPTVECPESLHFEVDDNCIWIVPDLTVEISASDNCNSSLTFEQSLSAQTEIPLTPDAIPITFTVTDDSGNQGTCDVSIFLEDIIPPTISLSPDLIQTNSLGECGAIVNFENALSTDNCGNTTIEQIAGPPSGSFFEVGTTQLVFVSTDQFGNSSEASFLIEIEDIEDPSITCPAPISLSTSSGECEVWLEFEAPIVSDNCAINSLTQISGPASGTWVNPGNYTVTFLAIDSSGNETECSFDVDIIDTTPPVIICPDNIIQANSEGLCGAFVSFDIVASDNCADFILTQIEGSSSGSYFPVGMHQITHQAIDSYGNETQCSFEIEVVDEEAPQIQCSWDINSSDPLVIYNMPISNDNCGIVDVELLSGLESGTTFASGSNMVEFIATDPSSNFSTCEFEIYVNSPPVASPIILTTHLNYLSINPLTNDYDADGDPFFLDSIDLPENARLEYDNTISYFPDKSTCVGDSIPYSIRDVHGAVASSYIKIELLCPELLEAPEGFSPNNDGINDSFVIDGLDDFPGSQINVFNEQGVRVFFSSAYKNNWEGTSNVGLLKGHALPEGKYYYVLEIKQNTIKQTGFIILKR